MTDVITIDEMLEIPAEEFSSEGELNDNPFVSVVMMTRNHEDYITQAVESVISQKCDFDIELLIGEDFSTDNTRSVCENLQKKYPHSIRLIAANKNVGITPNFLRLVSRCRGQYIALLEGDDYWTDDSKLQKQVAMMENHPEYSWCGAKTINRTFWAEEKEYYNLEDTLKRYILHTSTILFRSELLETYPCFPDVVGWISMVYAYLAQHGLCGFLNEVVSFYRIHPGGLWTGAKISKRMRLTWIFTDTMDDYFEHKYTGILYDRELWIYKMDTSMRLDESIWKHWIQSLAIVRLSFVRMIKIYPVRYILFAFGVFAQPVIAGYYQFRRKAAFRKRFSSLFNNTRNV